MRTFLASHKSQSFFITLFLFMPLFFVLIYSKNFMHIEHGMPKEDKINIAIKQFIQASQVTKPTQKTIQEPLKPIETKKEKPIAKPKKIVQNIQPKPTTLPKENTTLKQETTQHAITSNNHENISLSGNNNELLKEVKQAIDKALIYPRQAKKMRMSGEVLLEFTWTKDKNLLDLKILKSSKYKLLNESALETIRIASKNFPQYDKTYRIKIPLIYKIN
ncbi:energy transduction protein TonB [Campylobacter subantarcticus LMG 24377]|uniref:Energy transduction protein TonB n=2 Tax=Campylobacter subantarcticus TaxID=497724 RepID=A0A0A8H8R0_9BACT|nr:energy transducer TonB [Campylobacter subantarcticus]EAJ1261594.1 energy transducer TonB [Campylobacter lari]AJC90372.1 energy transduction protein TonB [Campylobacter subantarcticus LMG 24374]AJC92034.1 energy transduction protein TonB [Campylobacter subantarcticus LMG 24377]EAL3939621.1 TonB-like protein [Campylobacter lari]MPB99298.1 energy transducer TonB [Campylobacter subantarcticus]